MHTHTHVHIRMYTYTYVHACTHVMHLCAYIHICTYYTCELFLSRPHGLLRKSSGRSDCPASAPARTAGQASLQAQPKGLSSDVSLSWCDWRWLTSKPPACTTEGGFSTFCGVMISSAGVRASAFYARSSWRLPARPGRGWVVTRPGQCFPGS